MRDERLPTRQLWTQGQRECVLLCGLELPATDKCTRQINATHAHLASLTQAADGSTAGQPLPSEIWGLITEKQWYADYILAKLPSNGQKMVIRNDSRTCLCCKKCPASQHLAGWPLCLAGSEPTYVWIGSVDTEQVHVSCKSSRNSLPNVTQSSQFCGWSEIEAPTEDRNNCYNQRSRR